MGDGADVGKTGVGALAVGGAGIVKPSSGFNPTQLAGLTLWYDISDISTLYQDSAGTTPVTADGDPVGLVQDKSGNGLDATASGSARPTYKTDGTYHWLLFNGSSSVLDIPNTYDGAVDSDNTSCFGVQTNASTGYLLASTSDDGFEMLFSISRIRNGVGLTSGNYFTNGTTNVVNSDIVYTTDWTRSTYGVRGWQNQNLEVNATAADADKSNGANAWIGAGVNGSAVYMTGRVYQASVFDVKLSDDDRGSLESYIAEKSGVTL